MGRSLNPFKRHHWKHAVVGYAIANSIPMLLRAFKNDHTCTLV